MKFDKNEFILSILDKAKQKGLLKQAKKELELFEKYDQIEYLFIVKEFIKKLEEIGAHYTMLSMSGATSVVAFLLGIHEINPVLYKLSNKFFFDIDYMDGGIGPRFEISVPASKKEEAVKVLNSISLINSKAPGSIFRFGENDKYRLLILGNPYLERLNNAIERMISDKPGSFNKEEFFYLNENHLCNYKEVMDYLLAIHDKGISSAFCELIEIAKPKDLYDLAKIECFRGCTFKNIEKVLEFIKENGIDSTLFSREQFLNILIDVYEIEENTAFQIVKDVNKLTKWEKLTLKSHGVPENILDQIDNIKFLDRMARSLQKMHIAYYLSEINRLKTDFKN